ncbi:MAG: N-carbamoylputrescine amidase, partial [Pseudanabaena sp.]
SFIANHRGDKVAELHDTEEGVILASFDLDLVRLNRASFGFFRDRRPDLYQVILSP